MLRVSGFSQSNSRVSSLLIRVLFCGARDAKNLDSPGGNSLHTVRQSFSLLFCAQTKPGGGKETADMRGRARKTGGDSPQESREGGPHRGEEEEREVAYRLCVRQLHAAYAGARRHRRFHFLGHTQGHLHH